MWLAQQINATPPPPPPSASTTNTQPQYIQYISWTKQPQPRPPQATTAVPWSLTPSPFAPTNTGNVLNQAFPAFRHLPSPLFQAVDYHAQGGGWVPPHGSECLLALEEQGGRAPRGLPLVQSQPPSPSRRNQCLILPFFFLHVDESVAPSLFHTETLYPPPLSSTPR